MHGTSGSKPNHRANLCICGEKWVKLKRSDSEGSLSDVVEYGADLMNITGVQWT